MVTGIVFLNVERKSINKVAQQVTAIEGISEVYSVGGRFDLVAIIRARDNEQLADIVTSHLLAVEGITASETMIAFKVYSKHDLERMFSIGLDG
jgi:DNA-binding Lrp family transcriptional regulator